MLPAATPGVMRRKPDYSDSYQLHDHERHIWHAATPAAEVFRDDRAEQERAGDLAPLEELAEVTRGLGPLCLDGIRRRLLRCVRIGSVSEESHRRSKVDDIGLIAHAVEWVDDDDPAGVGEHLPHLEAVDHVREGDRLVHVQLATVG